MKSWRFKSRKNKIGLIILTTSLILLVLFITCGAFIVHWAFGIGMTLIWLILLGYYLSDI